MNLTQLNSLTDSELIRLTLESGDPLACLLADRLGDTLPARELADVLEFSLDFDGGPEDLERRLEQLLDKENALDERTAELETARADLAQAEADIRELKAELDALAANTP